MQLNIDSALEAEYQRVLAQIGPEDPYAGARTLGIYDVLKAHFLIADFFYAKGEGIAGVGPQSLNALHSAVHRQHVSFGGKDKWNDKFDLAATLMFGLIKDHPFHDANKRTAFLSTLYLLQKHKRCPLITHKEFEDFMVEVADDQLKRRSRYRQLVKNGCEDPEVVFISKYLREHTRQIDTRHYTITYRELIKLLERFDYTLDNPHHNTIDVIRYQRSRRIFQRGEKVRSIKIGTIGFPSLTKQVSKGDLKKVRQMCNLTHKDGVDNGAFFHGLDDMNSLIAEYQEALERLAHR